MAPKTPPYQVAPTDFHADRLEACPTRSIWLSALPWISSRMIYIPHRHRWFILFCSPLIIGLMSGSGLAQETITDEPVDFLDDSTSFQLSSVIVRPVVWFPGASGDVTFGQSPATELSIDSVLGLGDSEPTFDADFLFRFGWSEPNWSLHLNGFDFDTEASQITTTNFFVDGQVVNAGTLVDSDFSLTNFAAHIGYDPFGNLLNDDDVQMRLDLIGGGRFLNVEHRLDALGGPTVSYDQWHSSLEGGARLSIASTGAEIGRKGSWDVSLSLVAGTGGFFSPDADLTTIGLGVGASYHLTDHLGLTIGYHQIDFDLDDRGVNQRYKLKGRLAGLFVGGSIRF